MKVLGYKGFDWQPHGFAGGLPDDWAPFPTVEPVILPRPGHFPTFGPSEIGSLTIPVNFIITPENTIAQNQGFEAAWQYFFKRLNPYDTAPGELRCELNDETPVTIEAVIRILSRTGFRGPNQRLVDFVAVRPFFETRTAQSASGTFS